MSIAVNQIALSSDIIDKLHSVDEKPLRYLNGYEFFQSAGLPYYTNWNADAITLFNNGYIQLDNTKKSNLFKNTANAQINFVQSTLDEGTPKILVSFDIDKNVPVASFDDLSTFVVNAFLKFTNIRYSSFTLLKKIKQNTYVRQTYYGNAFLNDSAILGTNRDNTLNNILSNSQKIISNTDDFLKYSSVSWRINSNKPPADSSDKNSRLIETFVISNLISSCLLGENNIRRNLSCQFSEIPLTGPGSKVNIIYHELDNNISQNDKPFSVDIYTPQTIKNYNELFTDPNNIARFRGWNTRINSTIPDPNYSPGSTLYVQNQSINLWPVLKNIYNFNFHNTRTELIRNRSDIASFKNDVVIETLINGKITSYRVIEDQFFPIKSIGFDSKYSPFEWISGQTQNFKGYATQSNGSVAYTGGDVIHISKNMDFYPKFEPISKRLAFGTGTHWHAGSRHGTYNADIYPVVINLYNYGIEDINIFNKISFEFVGWVNEFDHTHSEIVFVDVQAGNGTTIVSHYGVYGYGGNDFSYHTSQLARADGYPGWGRCISQQFNIPSAAEGRDLLFYFYVEKGGDRGDGEGEVFVDIIKLE